MRYILDDDGYIEELFFSDGGIIECRNKTCVEYTGTVPAGYTSLENWAMSANVRAYHLVNGNLSLDSARLAELEAGAKEEDTMYRPVTMEDLYKAISIYTDSSRQSYSTFAKGNNFVEMDGAGGFAIPQFKLVKAITWAEVANKTWDEFIGSAATASGTSIDITDAADAPIRAFKIYGKSTQSSTPTPTTPVPIENVSNPVITVDGGTLGTRNITINKTLCGMDDVKDELIINADGTGKIIQKIGVYEFDGTETIGRNNQYDYVYYIAELGNLGGKAQAKESIMCDRYTTLANVGTNNIIYMRPSGNGFVMRDDRYQTLAELKAYLAEQKTAGTPVIVQYELATPIETDLPAEEVQNILALKTYSPSCTISNDKGAEMEITYTSGAAITWNSIGGYFPDTIEIVTSTKNLLPIEFDTLTQGGLTIKRLSDGGLSITGTATENQEVALCGNTEMKFLLKKGKGFYFSGLDTLSVKLYDVGDTESTLLYTGGNGALTPTTDYRISKVGLVIPSGTYNVTLYPQIEVGSEATDFEVNKRDYLSIPTAGTDNVLTLINGQLRLDGRLIDYSNSLVSYKYFMVNCNVNATIQYVLTASDGDITRVKIKADQIDLAGYTTIENKDGFGRYRIEFIPNDDDILEATEWSGDVIRGTAIYENDGQTKEFETFSITSNGDFKTQGQVLIKQGMSDAIYAYDDAGNETKVNADGITTPVLTQTSLAEKKKDFERAENVLKVVKNSDIYTFRFKTESETCKKHYGFVIGEGYNTPDEVIAQSGNGIDTYSMCAVLWKAVQELSAEVEQLKSKEEEA